MLLSLEKPKCPLPLLAPPVKTCCFRTVFVFTLMLSCFEYLRCQEDQNINQELRLQFPYCYYKRFGLPSFKGAPFGLLVRPLKGPGQETVLVSYYGSRKGCLS